MKRELKYNLKLGFIFFSLFLTLAAITMSGYAWFVFNVQQRVINPDIINSGDYKYSFSYKVNNVADSGQIVFNEIFPGDVHKNNIEITLTNVDTKNFFVTLYLDAPTANEEIPYVDNAGNYYYLGSQIQITKLDVLLNGNPVASPNGLNKFLVTTSSTDVLKGQNNSVTTAQTNIAKLNLVNEILIPAGQTISLNIDFTFVDNGTSQNVYMDDWASVGKSIRNIKASMRGENV